MTAPETNLNCLLNILLRRSSATTPRARSHWLLIPMALASQNAVPHIPFPFLIFAPHEYSLHPVDNLCRTV